MVRLKFFDENFNTIYYKKYFYLSKLEFNEINEERVQKNLKNILNPEDFEEFVKFCDMHTIDLDEIILESSFLNGQSSNQLVNKHLSEVKSLIETDENLSKDILNCIFLMSNFETFIGLIKNEMYIHDFFKHILNDYETTMLTFYRSRIALNEVIKNF
jgi:hypothetical protein